MHVHHSIDIINLHAYTWLWQIMSWMYCTYTWLTFDLLVHFTWLQIGLLGLQVIWTQDANEALKNARTNKKIMQATDNHFLNILDMLIELTTKELTKIERRKFETLITIHLHQRDIFHALVWTACINVWWCIVSCVWPLCTCCSLTDVNYLLYS